MNDYIFIAIILLLIIVGILFVCKKRPESDIPAPLPSDNNLEEFTNEVEPVEFMEPVESMEPSESMEPVESIDDELLDELNNLDMKEQEELIVEEGAPEVTVSENNLSKTIFDILDEKKNNSPLAPIDSNLEPIYSLTPVDSTAVPAPTPTAPAPTATFAPVPAPGPTLMENKKKTGYEKDDEIVNEMHRISRLDIKKRPENFGKIRNVREAQNIIYRNMNVDPI